MLSRLICWLWGHVWRVLHQGGTSAPLVHLLCDRCGRALIVEPGFRDDAPKPDPPEPPPGHTVYDAKAQDKATREEVEAVTDRLLLVEQELNAQRVGKAGACELGLIRDRISERLAVVERVVVELKLRFDAAHHGSNQTVSYFSEPLPKRQSRKL